MRPLAGEHYHWSACRANQGSHADLLLSAPASCLSYHHSAIASMARRMIDPDDHRSNPAENGAIVGTIASSAALVVAQREADFAVTSDHLSGARVSTYISHACMQQGCSGVEAFPQDVLQMYSGC